MTSLVRPRHRLQAALRDDESYGTTLLVLALDEWGTECLEWAPETWRQELQDTFDVQVPLLNFDKLMAAVSIVTTDAFFQNLPTFVDLANALCGSGLNPDAFDPADTAECAWACTEALILHPPDDGEEPFSDDIRRYLGFILKDEGYVSPPDILKLALDGDFKAQVGDSFSDDPELFAGIYQAQQAKTEEIEQLVRSNLQELLTQVTSLPLQRGDTAALIQRTKHLIGDTPHAWKPDPARD